MALLKENNNKASSNEVDSIQTTRNTSGLRLNNKTKIHSNSKGYQC